MKDEQRRHPRVSTHVETIYFTETRTEAGKERLYYPGLVTDKSPGGLGIQVNNHHDINEHIWLEGTDIAPTPLQACIRWINALAEDADEYRIGVEFLIVD
jgi:hypothetical protein